MQALRDHVISQISEDKLQPLAYKLELPQEVIDQLPVGKQGFEVMLNEWLKSGQCTWNDLVVTLCCPQVDEQQLSDQLIRKLQSTGTYSMMDSIRYQGRWNRVDGGGALSMKATFQFNRMHAVGSVHPGCRSAEMEL